MAEFAMLADIQRTVYPEEATRQLHVMAQGKENSLVMHWHSNQLCYAANSNMDVCYNADYHNSRLAH